MITKVFNDGKNVRYTVQWDHGPTTTETNRGVKKYDASWLDEEDGLTGATRADIPINSSNANENEKNQSTLDSESSASDDER